jgi:hypothetical protein
LSPSPNCFMVLIFFYFQHGQHVKGVTIIKLKITFLKFFY